ncbi:zinc finger protein 212-like isoform X2 [Myiozetetes cayanensis]|uniref:zinc finger protein 212-like isoform X2 n=1 Tax=Myiozetetes cayanensis TaxID=478635 RepID=UPI00215E5826|nr:zinc finger protein 212-like isoform X2 [Myiozetetes cayanensis]
MELLDGGSISLWTVVGAVQALERSVAAHASRLLSLEHRAGNAEKKHLEYEKGMGELGNQLDSKWTALGNLVQEYGQLQRRLENMENLLKNRNFWVLRLPPGGGVPKAPTLVLENDATGFSAQEWENLEEWQRELCRKVLAGKSQALVLPDDAVSEPALLSRLQGGEVPCSEDEVASTEIPEDPDTGPDGAGHNAQPPEDGGDRDGHGDPAENGGEDSIIQIKQEEELCTAVQEEEEAGEAPGEPCPEQTFCDPEASSQARKGKEVDARELPGAEGEDIPRHPATGFQTYATDVSSWIKREEEPRCPEQQHLEREEISADPSTDENTKRDPPADCFESTTCDSGAPGRPGERFPKDPSPGMPWDGQWNSEMMETNSTGIGNGYSQGFGEHLDFFSAQEKRPCVSKCERNSLQQDQPQAPQGQGEMFPGPTCERVFPLLHPQLGEKGMGPGAAPAPCPGPRSECGQTPMGTARLRDQDLGGEEPAENEENFPMDTSGACWDHPQARGSPIHQQQSQGRGKSYICSDCGKSFVCHSWLVRHQTTHTGERPYKCSECDKTYRRKDYLLNHQRRHTGEGLFQCPLCRKRFVLRRSLVKHQESHVQEAQLPLAGWPCADIRGSVMHSI